MRKDEISGDEVSPRSPASHPHGSIFPAPEGSPPQTMHELSLAAGILETVGKHAPSPACVREVHVTVGRLAGVSVEALEFGFGAIAHSEGYTNARLVVRSPGARIRCNGCGAEGEADGSLAPAPCSACGSFERAVISGTEFTLDSIEVED